MERIIVLGGGGDGVIIILGPDGKIHIIHPPRPDELQALTRTLEAAVRIEDKAVLTAVAETVGHAINAQLGRVAELTAV